MRWLILLVLLFATVTIINGEDEDEVETEDWDDDGILALTEDNFEEYIEENKFVLVEFYAPWCQHCQSFAPEYVNVAKVLEEKRSDIKVVKIDGSKESNVTKEYDVKGFPTLKFFRNGLPSEYRGGKQTKNIVDWLNKKTGPIAAEIKDVVGAEEFIKSQSVTIIGFFKDQGSIEAQIFLDAADAIEDYLFGITSNEKVYSKYGAKSGSIILFNNVEKEKSVFEGELSKTSIFEFVAVQSAPLIVDFNRNFVHSVFSVVKSHLLMFISKEAGHMEKLGQPIEDLAKEFKGKVIFVAINADDDVYQQILNFFRVKKEEIPTMRMTRIVDEVTNKYKPKNDDLSPENIRSFVQNGLDGKLQEDLLSQDLPEDWDKTPVKTLVSTNFDEVAFNPEKDVFVAFYAPWSEESKELASIIDELGEKYKDSETVVIAKIDATANELDPKHPKILLYPTLKLYKKDDNSIFNYTGVKTLAGFVKFIESGGEEVDFEDDEVLSEEEEEKQEEEEEGEEYKDEL